MSPRHVKAIQTPHVVCSELVRFRGLARNNYYCRRSNETAEQRDRASKMGRLEIWIIDSLYLYLTLTSIQSLIFNAFEL